MWFFFCSHYSRSYCVFLARGSSLQHFALPAVSLDCLTTACAFNPCSLHTITVWTTTLILPSVFFLCFLHSSAKPNLPLVTELSGNHSLLTLILSHKRKEISLISTAALHLFKTTVKTCCMHCVFIRNVLQTYNIPGASSSLKFSTSIINIDKKKKKEGQHAINHKN